MLTQIGCNVCGRPISQAIEVPLDFEVQGWIECVECLARKGPYIDQVVKILVDRFLRQEFYHGSDRRRAAIIDGAARDIVRHLDNRRFQIRS